MKKRKITGRILSFTIALLFIFQFAGAGAISVLAAEGGRVYEGGDYVYVGELQVGDILEEGVTLGPDFSGYGISSAVLHVNVGEVREFILNDEYYEITTEQTLIVSEIRQSPYSKHECEIFLKSYEEGGDADNSVTNEEELIAALESDQPIVLANDIELSDCFFVKDKREHVLDLNGCTLSRNMQSKESTGHVIQVNSGSKLTVTDNSEDGGGMITGGWAHNGGGFYVDGELVLDKCIIADNRAENGGAIFIRGGTVTAGKNVLIEENRSTYVGGAVYTDYGTLEVNGANIENNKSSESGGGIYNSPRGTLKIKDAAITMNTAGDTGGGVVNYGRAELKDSEISHNKSNRYSGGIHNNGTMTIEGCDITGNSCGYRGGGIYLGRSSNATFSGENRISANFAENGAGIYVEQNGLELDHVTIEYNTAKDRGGGIFYNATGWLTLKNVTVKGNAGGEGAKTGGGIYMLTGILALAGGKTIISGNTGSNTNSNIVLISGSRIYVRGAFASGSSVGFTLPDGYNSYDITDGYSKYNALYANQVFFSDTQYYRVVLDKDKTIPEARFAKRLQATTNRYVLKVTVKVTDDADWWDYAYLYIYGRDNNGQSDERYLTCSPDFRKSIDDDDEYYEYYLDCGKAFPSTVRFCTMYGTSGSWRDFEADVKVYINDVNCASVHCVHNVYGVEEKNTYIKIGGEKYPYPDLDIDQRAFIEPTDPSSAYITISAVDQYGVAWATYRNSYKIENLSFPKEDMAEDVNGNGMKWKMSTKKESDHFTVYRLTFYSQSNVYREITNDITVHFTYPMHLTVIVDGQTVYTETGTPTRPLTIPNLPCKKGYYIYGYKADGACYLKANEDGTYTFGFNKQDIVLEAQLKGIRYYVTYEKNGNPLLNDADVRNTMKVKSFNYDKEATELSRNCYKRDGYVFVGWNTKPDGSGTSYADCEKVKNLTYMAGEIVHLYAQWEPVGASTTASIFSKGTLTIYIGGAIILITLTAAAIYMIKKKNKNKGGDTVEQ